MRIVIILLFSFFITVRAICQDTFSIIAADPETGEIGAAGASCVDGIASFGGIQLLNKIIPGKGGVNAQAYVCINPHVNLELGIQKMEEGLSPEEIINWLIENDGCNAGGFNPQLRQYGIVDFDENMNVRSTAFTGTSTDDYKNHITGPNYAIQGNILLGQEVLDQMEEGFTSTSGTLAQKLMAAMQGANFPGADKRCLDRGTSSTSAFLRVTRPNDDMNTPYLELNVLEMPFGEEPIDSLQTLFNNSTGAVSTNDLEKESTLFTLIPNPVKSRFRFSYPVNVDLTDVRILNGQGKVVLTKNVKENWDNEVDVNFLVSGVYIVEFRLGNGDSERQQLVKL